MHCTTYPVIFSFDPLAIYCSLPICIHVIDMTLNTQTTMAVRIIEFICSQNKNGCKECFIHILFVENNSVTQIVFFFTANFLPPKELKTT